MTRRIDAEDIRGALPVADYAELHLGVEFRRSGAELRGTCPLCGSASRAPFCVRDEVWHCKSCDAGGDVMSLCEAAEDLDFSSAIQRLAGIAGLDSVPELDADSRARLKVAREARKEEQRQRDERERIAAEKRARELWEKLEKVSVRGLDYLRLRGVKTALGDVRFDDAGSVCVPLRQADGTITNIVRRRTDGEEPKVRGMKGCGTRGTFGDPRKLSETEGAIVIVEGFFDWLSARILAPKRLVLGAHGAGQLAAVVQIAAEAAGPHLGERGVVFVPHQDDVGERQARKALEVARELGVPDTHLYVFDLADEKNGEGSDDLNDHLQAFPKPAGSDPFGRVRSQAEIDKHRCFDLTDVGNSERFAHYHRDRLRYWGEYDQWLRWTGKFWDAALTQVQVVQACKEVTDHIGREAVMTKKRDSEMAEKLASWAKDSRSQARIGAMHSLARSVPHLQVKTGQLDSEIFLLNVENGTLDLRTGELRPHRREDLLTQLAPVVYDPEAKCPRWERFIAEVFEPNPDAAVFIQRFGGYSLTGDTSAQCLLYCQGKGGNGKGVIFRTLQSMLGEPLAYQAAFDTFLRKRGGDAPKVELAAMRGARMVLASESDEDARLNEGLIKSITGGDKVTGEAKFKPPLSYQPRYKLWLASNPLPNIKSTDEGFWRRFKFIEFLVNFENERRDDHLEEYLNAHERPGIFRWFVEGALAWQHDGGGLKGLGDSKAVTEATAKLRKDSDALGRFLEDRCLVNSEVRVDTTALYRAYSEWCQERGKRPMNDSHFGRTMKQRGIDRMKSNSRRYYTGIGLIAERSGDGEWP